jgi:hypothetical protein
LAYYISCLFRASGVSVYVPIAGLFKLNLKDVASALKAMIEKPPLYIFTLLLKK